MSVVGFLWGLGATLADIVGDAVLKTSANIKTWHNVGWGCLIYGGSAILWYMSMRSIKLVTFAIFFPVITCVCVAALGILVFKERITSME